MRVIKPLRVGLLQRSFSIGESHRLAIKPVLFFDLLSTQSLISEAEAWKTLISFMPREQVFDEAMPKAKPEVLLQGTAYAPLGQPVTELTVELDFGAVDKRLRVTGNRIWQKSFLSRRATPPADFTQMPLSWERSFGYKDYPENPIGQGAISIGPSEETLVALPNIEYPDDSLTTPKGVIRPANFGAIAPLWAPRSDSNALFDQEYMDKVFPSLPESLDLAVYNAAPRDQHLDEILGDEEFRLTNLHRDRELITGLLPQYVPRVFANRLDSFEEVNLVPETLWLLPDLNLGALLFCGVLESNARFAQLEIDNLLLAYESRKDPARDPEYYKEVLELRTNIQTAGEHAFNESQLSPQLTPDQREAREKEHADEVNRLEAEEEREWARQKEKFEREHGVAVSDEQRPKSVDPRLVVAPAATARGDFSLSGPLQYAEEKKIEGDNRLIEARRSMENGPQPPSMTEEQVQEMALSRTRDQRFLSDDIPQTGVATEKEMPTSDELRRLELSGLAAASQPMPLSVLKAQDAGTVLRDAITESRSKRESLAFRDFTGADLSGFNFDGENCEGSIFECANLENCSFVGASLMSTSFLSARISGCTFDSSNLTGANFNYATGEGVSFQDADLGGTVMMNNSDISEAVFSGAKFGQLLANNSSLQHSKFFCSDEPISLVFSKTDLRGSEFSSISLNRSSFIDCDFRRTDWRDVDARQCVLLNARMQLTNAEECRFELCQFGGDSWMTLSRWANTTFYRCGFRSAVGTGVSFENSTLNNTDLGMVSFRSANFRSANLSECIAANSDYSYGDFGNALLMKTNFTESLFIDSNLTGTDFYQSDVLLAELAQANTDEAKNIIPTKLERLDRERR